MGGHPPFAPGCLDPTARNYWALENWGAFRGARGVAVAEFTGYVAPPVVVAPLAPAVAEQLRALPSGGDGELYRRMALERAGGVSRVMRRAEAVAQTGAITPRQLAELWLWGAYLEMVRGFRGDTTVQQYLRSVCRLLEWAKATGLDHATLTPADFDRWQTHLAIVLRHSAVWRMRQVAAVRGFYDWRGTRRIGENIASDLRGPREPTGMPRKYSLPQLQGMLAATTKHRNATIRVRDIALLLFLMATGARREELSRVDLRDLHLGQRSGLVRFNGKGAKQREVSFEGPVVEALRAWLLQREQLPFGFHVKDGEAVFIGLEGIGRGCRMRPRAIERRVARYARDAGLRDWGVHRFRVTFATALYDDNAGIEEIRLLMGHESIETTRRYLAVSERMRRTRLRADRQHEALGTRNTGQPRWMRAIHGDVT